jgi:hypothetical protein
LSKTEIYEYQPGKSDYSSYIEYTWTSNTVTAQEYYGPGEPTYYKTVITFDNNDRMEMIEEWDQPSKAGEWYLYSYTEFTYTNKNLVLTERYYPESVKSGSVREHSFRKSIPSEFPSAKGQLAPFLATRSEATYDSKTNPFIMYPALAILFADDIPYVYTSKNNPTNVSYTDYREGTNTWDVDFTYEFDAKGFPIEVIQYESYDSWSYVETWTISYM